MILGGKDPRDNIDKEEEMKIRLSKLKTNKTFLVFSVIYRRARLLN